MMHGQKNIELFQFCPHIKRQDIDLRQTLMNNSYLSASQDLKYIYMCVYI